MEKKKITELNSSWEIMEAMPHFPARDLFNQAIQVLKNREAEAQELSTQLIQLKQPQESSIDEKTKAQIFNMEIVQVRRLIETITQATDLMELAKLILARLEIKEQVITVLNEQTKDVNEQLTKTNTANEKLHNAYRIASIERNTLSQALRIACSQGKIDPVTETHQDEV